MKIKGKILSLLAATTLIVSCTTNPYTGERQASKTGKYAAVGAVGGALAGQLVGGDTKSTLIGAGIGTAIGGGVGLYMDNQEAQLREELQGTGVQIQRNGNEINLIMPGNITFETDQYAIKKSFYNVLNSVAIVLKKYDKTHIVIDGHTDSTGSRGWNRELSEKRANSVRDYLLAQGVAYPRMRTTGYGQSKPIASNSTAYGRQQNRRVEITLIPIK